MSNLISMSASHKPGSAWDDAENYHKEHRQISRVAKIEVLGSLQVVFFRTDEPVLVVAGETQEAISSVKTKLHGSKLIIEREGVSINVGGNCASININGSNITINGTSVGQIPRLGKVIVGLGMPVAPDTECRGSGDIEMYNIDQPHLSLSVSGSGEISAYGSVGNLNADVRGSGEIDASELHCIAVEAEVSGSGDMEVKASGRASARVAGSGDITIYGSPPERTQSISGSGRIRFKA